MIRQPRETPPSQTQDDTQDPWPTLRNVVPARWTPQLCHEDSQVPDSQEDPDEVLSPPSPTPGQQPQALTEAPVFIPGQTTHASSEFPQVLRLSDERPVAQKLWAYEQRIKHLEGEVCALRRTLSDVTDKLLRSRSRSPKHSPNFSSSRVWTPRPASKFTAYE
ncbi:hypothetical protein BDN72DRAFT_894245 [Pluteus cervinus]|uniref:Uncharacterized protein n=1 Tax=Pluteus cervinus TaxID=181527 RepID=A0ACD3B7N5_9AGAR|nr:hypothetical protein BDN72DRAFT_894245 [Pluteus cervinus]